MNPDFARTAVKFVARTSSSFVVASVIGHNTSHENNLQKAEVVIGGFVISAIIGEKVDAWTERKLDQLQQAVKDIREKTA